MTWYLAQKAAGRPLRPDGQGVESDAVCAST